MENNSENQTNQNTNPVVLRVETPEEALQLETGFKRVEAIVRAMPRDRLDAVNLDVPSAVQTVLGAFPEIIEHRSILSTLGTFDISNVDNLRDYASALGHTHVRYRTAGGVIDNIPELAVECMDIRDRFHTDALALSKRKFVDPARVEKVRGGSSYRMIAFDILSLVEIFKEKWGTIEGNTGLRMAEIEDAALKANRLLTGLGIRDQSTPAANEAAVLRQQAYTLLIRAYNEARNALAFARRNEGDVDDIAPSLFAGRGRRSSTPGEVVPTPVASPQPTPEAQPSPEPEDGLTAMSVPIGFPGSSPIKTA